MLVARAGKMNFTGYFDCDQKAGRIHRCEPTPEIHGCCFVHQHIEDSIPPIIERPPRDCNSANVRVNVSEPVIKLGDS